MAFRSVRRRWIGFVLLGILLVWGTVFFDFDNDGWQDLYLTQGPIELLAAQSSLQAGKPNTFMLNNGDGTFSGHSAASGLNDPGAGRNDSIVDLNGDGYVDVLLNNLDTELRLYLNQEITLGNTNHWLVVTVQGSTSNRDGIGSRLTLTTDSLTQIREITSGPTHGGGDYRAAFFGMGSSLTGTLSIRWPGGITETIGTVIADQYLHLVEPVAQQSVKAVTTTDRNGTNAIPTLSLLAIGSLVWAKVRRSSLDKYANRAGRRRSHRA